MNSHAGADGEIRGRRDSWRTGKSDASALGPEEPSAATLAALGARGLPHHVSHIASRTLSSSHEPVVATFALFFLVTGGKGCGHHLELVDVRPGELHFIPAGVEIHALNEGELEGWLVAFDPTLLNSLETEPPGRAPVTGGPSAADLASSLAARWSFRLLPGEARRQQIERLIAALDAELSERLRGFERATSALFTLLLTELQREAREHASGHWPSPGRLVRDVLAFIATHSLEPISLADVAAVDRTPSYVATAVHEETGLTVGDWLLQRRGHPSARGVEPQAVTLPHKPTPPATPSWVGRLGRRVPEAGCTSSPQARRTARLALVSGPPRLLGSSPLPQQVPHSAHTRHEEGGLHGKDPLGGFGHGEGSLALRGYGGQPFHSQCTSGRGPHAGGARASRARNPGAFRNGASIPGPCGFEPRAGCADPPTPPGSPRG
ncbi:hypothetical protein [Archangium lansingense]|uniref:hypothetical protein n=1 Tax=Archangium lansingense TaxID=2995310 RepID=UPI00358DBD56